MGFWGSIGKFFGVVAGFAKRAFDLAQKAGLTDVLTAAAANLVEAAASTIDTNEERKAFVFAGIKAAFPKVPDSIINLAIELAVQAFKARKPAAPAPVAE